MSVTSMNSITGVVSPGNGLNSAQAALPRVSLPPSVPEHIEVVEAKHVSNEFLQNAVDEANKLFIETRSDVRFVIDKESNKVVIKLIEQGTGEVINQYPTDQALAISHSITRAQQQAAERHAMYKSGNNILAGILFNQKT